MPSQPLARHKIGNGFPRPCFAAFLKGYYTMAFSNDESGLAKVIQLQVISLERLQEGFQKTFLLEFVLRIGLILHMQWFL